MNGAQVELAALATVLAAMIAGCTAIIVRRMGRPLDISVIDMNEAMRDKLRLEALEGVNKELREHIAYLRAVLTEYGEAAIHSTEIAQRYHDTALREPKRKTP